MDDTLTKFVEAKNVSLVKQLLDHGAATNFIDQYGYNALMIASDRDSGSSEIIELLVASRTDINGKNKDGVTALMAAAGTGNIDAVKILIDLGADVNLTDNDGWTALKYAQETDEVPLENVIKILKIQ